MQLRFTAVITFVHSLYNQSMVIKIDWFNWHNLCMYWYVFLVVYGRHSGQNCNMWSWIISKDLLKTGAGSAVPRGLDASYNIDVCNAFISKTIQARYPTASSGQKSLMMDFPNNCSIVLTYPHPVLFLSMSWLKITMEGKIWQSSFSSTQLVNQISCTKWYLVNCTVLGVFLLWNMTNVKSTVKVAEMGCDQN